MVASGLTVLPQVILGCGSRSWGVEWVWGLSWQSLSGLSYICLNSFDILCFILWASYKIHLGEENRLNHWVTQQLQNIQAFWWGTRVNALWSRSSQKLPPSFEKQYWDNLRLSSESEKACYTTHLLAKKGSSEEGMSEHYRNCLFILSEDWQGTSGCKHTDAAQTRPWSNYQGRLLLGSLRQVPDN